MSWQAGSFAILGLVLLGGFAWYERSKPPSQIVALVAALAALAVAGRVAFPVLPNVVATTDVVIFTGYAIGAAPGFAVGALAGLISNFWLGQGPWTPWQMAGWGMCGLAGAWLGAVSGRRLGRIPLAIVCGIGGYAFGALLDFSLMVTYGGDQSLSRFLALSARGVPFNVAHATGNIVIALVAGPAMVRMLVRFRERFEVKWRPRRAYAGSLLLFLLALSSGLVGQTQPSQAAGGLGRTAAWLRGAQNADGGLGASPATTSDPAITGWAALGLEAAGRSPLDFSKCGKTPISFLRASAARITTTGDLERTILVLRGAGLSANRLGSKKLVAELRGRRGGDGSWAGQVNLTAFGILALEAARSGAGDPGSAGWLRSAQNPDGGWGIAPRTASDPDSTGAAMQAIAVAGGGSGALARAVDYLRRAQSPGGGFALQGGLVNSQSTAWAVQGLLAAGTPPGSLRNGASPLDYLAARRASDGHYRYSESSDQTPVWVTGQVLAPVELKPFPIAPVRRKRAHRRSHCAAARSRGGAAATSSTGSVPGASTAATATTSTSSKAPAAGAAATGTSAARRATGTTPSTPTTGGAQTTTAVTPSPTPNAPAPITLPHRGGGGGTPGWVFLLAAAALGAAIWGGWVRHRRRLP